jgi:serine/threonine protein kinase
VIAQGSDTYICQAFDTHTRKIVAIKLPMIGCQQTSVEARILQKLNHPSIIPLLDIVGTADGPALVFPQASGSDLFKHVVSNDGLSESNTREIMFRLLNAVNHCHTRGIIHRDIKLENILVMSDNIQDVVLADFGYATDSPEGEECSGSVDYSAPEIWKRSPYTEKVDIWSLGVILFILIVADYPYVIDEVTDPLESISEGIATLERHQGLQHISKECRDLLERMLEIDPLKRISASDAITHNWFVPFDRLGLELTCLV